MAPNVAGSSPAWHPFSLYMKSTLRNLIFNKPLNKKKTLQILWKTSLMTSLEIIHQNSEYLYYSTWVSEKNISYSQTTSYIFDKKILSNKKLFFLSKSNTSTHYIYTSYSNYNSNYLIKNFNKVLHNGVIFSSYNYIWMSMFKFLTTNLFFLSIVLNSVKTVDVKRIKNLTLKNLNISPLSFRRFL